MIISSYIHVAANGIVSFFLMAEKYSIVYMYHIFFIHSSVDGHLGCFLVLAIMNSAAMNIGMHVSFWVIVLSGYITRSGIADHIVILFLSFLGTCTLFSIVAAPTYIPTNCAEGFLFLHTLSSICYLYSFK